ncbi:MULTISPECIES: helix-turn-helix transcriptional regulator [unclassified Microbacterium]|uniref:helix-turn-helix transcriptional regulator n=1 Tax=unclassified Microbacterium TaxID=2609290 RepID=UPI00300F8532
MEPVSLSDVEWASENLAVLGVPVAAHIAGRLASETLREADVLREMAAQLTVDQLAGREMLPKTLPVGPVLVDRAFEGLDGLSAAGRRLLMTAAFSVVDSLDVVLAAAATELDDVVSGPADGALRFATDGTFRFADPRLRLALRKGADPEARIAIHRSLAKAMDSRDFALATWHLAKSGMSVDGDLVRSLTHLASRLLKSGASPAAYYVATDAALRTSAEARARVELLRAQAALMSGADLSAARILGALTENGDPGTRERAAVLLRAARGFADRDGANLGERLARQQLALAPAAATTADALHLAELAEIADARSEDPREADRLQARMFLALGRAAPEWPWRLRDGAVSPAVEAAVRLHQVGFLVHVGDVDGAGAVLRNTLPRLPLAGMAGGALGGLLRQLKSVLPELGGATGAMLPAPGPGDQPARTTAAAAGRRSSAVTRKTHPVPAAALPRLPEHLTDREQQIAQLVAGGRTNREIGAVLDISDRTVEVHLGNIYRKLQVRGRLGLAAAVLA